MLSKHWVINILTPAFPGCVCPINIPMRGNVRLFIQISWRRFLLNGCCKECFDTLADVQRFWFKDQSRGSSKIKPIYVELTVTIVLLHWNMVIGVATDGYQIWYVGINDRCNRRKCVSNHSSTLGNPTANRARFRTIPTPCGGMYTHSISGTVWLDSF